MAKQYADMTQKEKAAVDAVRARHRTPEARAAANFARRDVEREFPPLTASPEVNRVFFILRAERERRNMSLADVAKISGIDKSYLCRLENGDIPNPTISTVARYASAIKKRLAMSVEDMEPVEC